VRKEHLDIPVAVEKNDVPPLPVPREVGAGEINILRREIIPSKEDEKDEGEH